MDSNLHKDPKNIAKFEGSVSRLEATVDLERFHVGTNVRSRIVAFEMVRHMEEMERIESEGHNDRTDSRDRDLERGEAAMAFVVNPYCVAAMPEEIRKGFLKKVLGIVSSQLLYLMLIILLFRYVWVEDVKTTVITAANQSLIDASGGELGQAVLNTTSTPRRLGMYMASQAGGVASLIALMAAGIGYGSIHCTRRKHPWNLLAFTFFSTSFGFLLGMMCSILDNDVFLFSTGGTLMFTIVAFVVSMYFESKYLNLCNFSLIALGMGLTMMFSLQFGVKGATWGGSAVCGVVVMTFCMWIIFDIQAMQIDLTADEYVTAAADIYLDVMHGFLWLCICMVVCFGGGDASE